MMERTATKTASAGRSERNEMKSLDFSDEFRPRANVINVFNLRDFGVPQIPSIGQKANRQMSEASPWHTHRNCIEFVYCTTGACEYESDGQRFSLTPGMMFVSRPHEPHRQVDSPKGYATFFMLFKPTANESIRWIADRFSRLPRLFSCSRAVTVRFGKILALAERGDVSVGARMRMQTYIHLLWFEILDSVSLSIRKTVPEVFSAIAESMRQHPERDYPLDDLVSESGVSKASFISLFKTAHGLTPHAYLLNCRIEGAKRFLADGLSVKSVADRFGFRSVLHFSRTFRKFIGITPRKWLAGKRA